MKWILVCLLAVGVALPRTAVAQYVEPNDYCYGTKCFDALSKAEAEMRSAEPNGQYLVRDRTVADYSTAVDRRTAFYYKYADRPPETIFPAGYSPGGWTSDSPRGFCTPTTSPYYSTWCGDEAEAARNLYAHDVASFPQCQYSPYSITGEHIIALVGSGYPYTTGTLYFNGDVRRKVVYTRWCPGWDAPDPVSFEIQKVQSFTCPTGYGSKVGYGADVDWPLVCQNGATPVIIGKVKQVDTCPANGNPCHPATGDKSRQETDFVFAGRPFIRNYHSLRQFDDVSIGPGWSHNFGERIYPYQLYLVNEKGTYESFSLIDGARYRLENSQDRVLDASSTGYTIIDRGGEIKEFDRSGLLLAIRNPHSPSRDVRLVYSGNLLVALKDSFGRQASFQYLHGELTSIELPDGSVVTYGRDSDRNLTAVDYGGATRRYHYHEDGLVAGPEFRHHLTGITAEDGQRFATFSYDSSGRVASSRLHSQTGPVETTLINYVSATSAVVATDGVGTRTFNFQNGTYRQPLSVVDGAGTRTTAYRTDGRIDSMLDRAQTTTQYEYTGSYRSATVEAVGTSSERRIAVQRDTSNREVRREVWSRVGGNQVLEMVELKAYDSQGHVVARCSVNPEVVGAQEYTCGSSTTPPGGVRQTLSRYCEQADVTAGACPAVGLVAAVDGPRTDANDVTTYSYYSADHPGCTASPAACQWRKGDLWKVTNALGQVTETLRYDGAGRVLSVKDANGVVTDFEYHPRGWLTARKVRGADNGIETDDKITRIDYYPTGLASNTTLPDGSFTSYVYDAAHRLTDIVDADGNSIHYTLDNAGNRIKEEVKGSDGSLKRVLSRVYNQLGQLQTEKDAGNHQTGFTYDANSNLDTTTDALGRVSDNDYDPLDRLSRAIQDAGGIAAATGFKYDSQDHLTEVVDPKGLSTKYQHNAFGDQTRLESPDTGVTLYGYDSAGNRTSALDARGEPSAYTYDALNRLTGITYSDAALNVAYTYDLAQAVCEAGETFAIGRLTRMDDGSGDTRYCYDRFGNLTRKVQTTNGQSFTLRYAYTKAGQLAAMQYPDGMVVDYVRDGLGRVAEVGVTPDGGVRQVLLAGASYHPFGPVAGWNFGNGRTMSRTLDPDYRPKTILSTGTGAGGLNLGFGWDAVGNLASLHTSGLEQPPRVSFDYDTLNRLTAFRDGAAGAAIEQYAYDATGNRTGFTNAGGTEAHSYPANSHRLTAVGATARTYDAMGNTTAIGGTAREFAYNAAGRMSEVQRDNVVAMQYGYNGKGEQVRKHLGTSSTYALYDESGQWLGEYGNAGTPNQQIVWLDSLPVGVIAHGQLNYIEADHLGTPRAVIEPQRDVAVWTWDMAGEAFGNSVPSQDPDADGAQFKMDMRLPGQRYDAATGLNHNYFRDYDTSLGRYAQSDPVGLRGGISSFGYVGASPLMYIDFFGLAACSRTRFAISPWMKNGPPQLQSREAWRLVNTFTEGPDENAGRSVVLGIVNAFSVQLICMWDRRNWYRQPYKQTMQNIEICYGGQCAGRAVSVRNWTDEEYKDERYKVQDHKNTQSLVPTYVLDFDGYCTTNLIPSP